MSLWNDLLVRLGLLSGGPPPSPGSAPLRPERLACRPGVSGGLRFAVDPVDPAQQPCSELDPAEVMARAVGSPPGAPAAGPLAAAARGPFIEVPDDHPLVGAVHRAFTEHRPLVLTPDAVWLTLAHGIAVHIEQNAERLRGRLVQHEGKRALVIPGPADGTLDEVGWASAIARWCGLVEAEVGPGLPALFRCDFSTTTPEAEVASRVLLMSALKRYFDFEMLCICGIPEVELRGTPEDWRRIRARVEAFEALELGWWAERLRPILDALVETAEGRPDGAFWRQIWGPLEVYGGENVVGWVAELFPYVCQGADRQPTLRNPLFDKTYAARLEAAAELKRAGRTMGGPGLSPGSFPGGLGMAPLVQRWPDASSRDLELLGGLLGVRQTGLDLEPVAGWFVREAPPLSRLLRLLREQGQVLPPVEGPSGRRLEAPAELLRLSVEVGGRRFERGPSGGPRLDLLPQVDWRPIRCGEGYATCFARTADDRWIGCTAEHRRGQAMWTYLSGRVVTVTRGSGRRAHQEDTLTDLLPLGPDLLTALRGLDAAVNA